MPAVSIPGGCVVLNGSARAKAAELRASCAPSRWGIAPVDQPGGIVEGPAGRPHFPGPKPGKHRCRASRTATHCHWPWKMEWPMHKTALGQTSTLPIRIFDMIPESERAGSGVERFVVSLPQKANQSRGTSATTAYPVRAFQHQKLRGASPHVPDYTEFCVDGKKNTVLGHENGRKRRGRNAI